MAWIESHQSLATHRKTKDLQRLLRINTVRVVGHLHLLWWWCLDNAPDGILEGIHPSNIADAAMWPGDPEIFVKALEDSGFCDANPLKLHDWDDYAGKLIQRRVANRERVKAFRTRNVRVTYALGNGATVPNSTQPIPKEIVKKVASVMLPDWLKRETWEGFLAMRKSIRKPMTEYAEKLLIEKLKKAIEKGHDPNELLAEATMNSWQGPVIKEDRNNGRTGINRSNFKPLPSRQEYTEPYRAPTD
jgi:hypothetical protein